MNTSSCLHTFLSSLSLHVRKLVFSEPNFKNRLSTIVMIKMHDFVSLACLLKLLRGCQLTLCNRVNFEVVTLWNVITPLIYCLRCSAERFRHFHAVTKKLYGVLFFHLKTLYSKDIFHLNMQFFFCQHIVRYHP